MAKAFPIKINSDQLICDLRDMIKEKNPKYGCQRTQHLWKVSIPPLTIPITCSVPSRKNPEADIQVILEVIYLLLAKKIANAFPEELANEHILVL